MNKEKIIIYTDGSSLGNPGPGGWGAIVTTPQGDVIELGGADKNTTNNKMELTAVIEALKYLKNTDKEIIVYTDSSYTINGITKWVKNWQVNDWKKKDKTDVLNRDLWEALVEVVKNKSIKWTHVSGHSGLPGNERADEIATSFARGVEPNLFKGPEDKYDIDVLNVSYDEKRKSERSVSRTRLRTKAYSYLSLVDGVLKRHSSWSECEARVKGRKGVKYKKALSKKDEDVIIKEWEK